MPICPFILYHLTIGITQVFTAKQLLLFVLFFIIFVLPQSLSHYDRKYYVSLSLCGITEKYWALEIQSYSSSSFWHTDFFHKSKWLGGGGHLGIGIATTQHIIYPSKNSKSIYHAAAPLHRVVRNIGAPTLSCQKAAWAMWNCQIILAFVRNCKSIYIA